MSRCPETATVLTCICTARVERATSKGHPSECHRTVQRVADLRIPIRLQDQRAFGGNLSPLVMRKPNGNAKTKIRHGQHGRGRSNAVFVTDSVRLEAVHRRKGTGPPDPSRPGTCSSLLVIWETGP